MIILLLALLYISLAATVGLALLRAVPAESRPRLIVPRGLEQAATGGVIGCALLSAGWTALELSDSFGVSLAEAAAQVLTGTTQGLGLLGVLLFGSLWYGIDALAPAGLRRPGFLAASLGLALSAAGTMHAASLSAAAYWTQAAHLLAVSVWLGVLFAVGWFAARGEAWAPFYRWYSPLAFLCVAVVGASGFVLMSVMSSDWLNAWTLDYGQALLWKHLLIVPLLVFASVNGWLIGPRASRAGTGQSLDPRGWMRGESALSLLIFAVTAALSRQTPPHDVAQTLSYTQPSAWFVRWYSGAVTPQIELALQPGAMGWMLGGTALLFLGVIYIAYARKVHPSLAVCASLLFAAVGYIAAMMSVVAAD